MPFWNIWCEGYAVTGESGVASLMASDVEGKTFQEACDNHFDGFRLIPDRNYNSERLTYWACRLYPDEASARKAFG